MELDEVGHPENLWKNLVDVGLVGLPFEEKYGGSGGSFLDLAIVLEEIGYACTPGPFFATVVLGGLPISLAGSEDQKKKYLSAISEGKVATLALVEEDGGYNPDCMEVTATADGDNYVISGNKLFVQYAHVADIMLVLARTGKASAPGAGLTMFIVDGKSQGITCEMFDTIAGDKQCEVIFDKVKVPKENVLGEVDKGWEIMEKVLDYAVVALCADLLGAGQQVLEMSVAYSCERIAFGKPIGAFQAIQHHVANMKVDVDGMWFMTYQAAWRLSEGISSKLEVVMAKAWVNEAFKRVAALGQQIHGSRGYTSDHDMQLYYRRGKATEPLFGDTDEYRDKVATELGL